MATIESWYRPLLGRYIDLDGAYPGECHDVFLSYLYWLGGKPGDGHAPGTGYTDQVWRQFPNYRPGLAKMFDKTYGTGSIKKGSIVFWSAYGGVGGLPHVAIALGPAMNGRVQVVTQNPVPVSVMYLTTTNILGTLNLKSTPAPKPPVPKEDTVSKFYHREDHTARNGGRPLAPGAGFWLHTAKGAPISNASNCVGEVGAYTFVAHIYAEGTPGDELMVKYVWQNKGHNSPHYQQRVVIGKSGRIELNFPARRDVGAGDSVFLRVDADRGNNAPVKVVLADSDATSWKRA